MKLGSNTISKISLSYLLISLFIFLCFWLNPLFAGVSVIALMIIWYKLYDEKEQSENTEINIKKDYIIIAVLIALLWCFLGGIGGYFWQYLPDWNFRNATINDLTTHSWPVIYTNRTALVYYFGFYLPPILLGKIFGSIFFLSNTETIALANGFSLIYAAFGVFLCFLNLFVLTKSENKKWIITILIFILFSGMDLFIGHKPHQDWHPPFSYLSNNIQLFYSYHIAIPIWLTTSILLNKLKNTDFYGLFGILYIFFCPQTIYASGLIMAYLAFQSGIKSFINKDLKNFIKKVFDIKNALSIAVLFPILYLFYMSNYTSQHFHFYLNKPELLAFQSIIFGAGIYLAIIGKKYYKDSLYYLSVTILILFPFIAFKTDYDFMMRATIPAFFIMMVMIIKFLFDEKIDFKFSKYLLVLCLLIGSIIPISLIDKAFLAWNHNIKPMVKNNIKTFEGRITPNNKPTDNIFDYRNYASINYNKYVFWKYLAKKR